jgi:hypothetical protein
MLKKDAYPQFKDIEQYCWNIFTSVLRINARATWPKARVSPLDRGPPLMDVLNLKNRSRIAISSLV